MVRPMPGYPSLGARVPSTEETVVSVLCSRRLRPPGTDDLVYKIRVSQRRQGGQSSRGDRPRRWSRELCWCCWRGRRVGCPGFRGLWHLDSRYFRRTGVSQCPRDGACATESNRIDLALTGVHCRRRSLAALSFNLLRRVKIASVRLCRPAPI